MDLHETRERIIYEKQGAIAKIALDWPENANFQDQSRSRRWTRPCTMRAASTTSRCWC